jgi:hypothetical protein
MLTHGSTPNEALADDYTNFPFLAGKRFSIIICLSVIQYYKDTKRSRKVNQNKYRESLCPGQDSFIADIPNASGMVAHVYGLWKGAFRRKRLLEISEMFYTVATAKHRTGYLSSGLLTFSDTKLKGLIGKLNLDADMLTRLTVNENRRHLLIRF